MKTTFKIALQLVLTHEGGFVDHPKDPGGATMAGVTLATFRSYYGADRTAHHLKNITQEQLAHIYLTGFWKPARCDSLPAGLDYALFDFAVNAGVGRAGKTLQQVVGVTADGVIGRKTLDKVVAAALPDLIVQVCDNRMAFLKGLDTFPTFGKGWSARVKSVRTHALAIHAGTFTPAR